MSRERNLNEPKQIHVKLPASAIQFLQARVAAGEYSDVSDVVLEGIGLLQSQALDSDEWIRSEVLPALEEFDKAPGGGLTPAQMRSVLSADAD